MDILEEIEVEIREGLMREAFNSEKSLNDGLKVFLKTALRSATDNPFFKNLTGDDYLYLVRKLPEERLNAHLINDSAAVTRFMDAYGLANAFKVKDPVLVANVFHTLFFVTMHKTELGADRYGDTIDLLVEMVVDYLVEPG